MSRCESNSSEGTAGYQCTNTDGHTGSHGSGPYRWPNNDEAMSDIGGLAERMSKIVGQLAEQIDELKANRDEAQANLAAMTENRGVWQRRAAKWRNQVSEVRAEQSSELNFDDYLLATDVTAVYPGVDAVGHRGTAAYLALGVTSEAGEVADVIKKALRNGDALDNPDVEARLRSELGDVLWYVARFCRENGWSLAGIAKENLEKLNARKESGELKQRRDYFPGLPESASATEGDK